MANILADSWPFPSWGYFRQSWREDQWRWLYLTWMLEWAASIPDDKDRLSVPFFDCQGDQEMYIHLVFFLHFCPVFHQNLLSGIKGQMLLKFSKHFRWRRAIQLCLNLGTVGGYLAAFCLCSVVSWKLNLEEGGSKGENTQRPSLCLDFNWKVPFCFRVFL